MTETNPTAHPGQPDENDEAVMKPDAASNYPEPDIFDYIDEATAQITDAEIEDRLRRTLHRAGYQYAGPSTDPAASEDGIQDLEAIDRIMWSHGERADAIDEALNQPYLSCGDGTSHKGDLHLVLNIADLQQADRITPAVLHQWWLLQSARDEVHAAHQEAKQIISAATERSDQALTKAAKIVRNARNQAQQIISDAQCEAELIREAAESPAAESQAVQIYSAARVPGERNRTCAFGQQAERAPVTARDTVTAALSVLPDLAAAVLPETYLSALAVLGAMAGATVCDAFKLGSLARAGLASGSLGERSPLFPKEALDRLLTGTDKEKECLRIILERVGTNNSSETFWEETVLLTITGGNGTTDPERSLPARKYLELECGEGETDTSVSDSLIRH